MRTPKWSAILAAVARVGPPPFFQRWALPLLRPSVLRTVVALSPCCTHKFVKVFQKFKKMHLSFHFVLTQVHFCSTIELLNISINAVPSCHKCIIGH
nr:MAG TPA: hypothetical protein [Caudoviricetes sp.]